MTVPPHGSPQHEVRRRIAGCRERLRRNRATQKGLERGESREGGGGRGGDESAPESDDEGGGYEPRTGRSEGG
jgi:hypothetical protein